MRWLARRGAAWLMGLACLAGPQGGVQAKEALGFDDVARQAQQLAARPFQAAVDNVPAALKQLNYDQHRDIRFRRERALWREQNLPFELTLFHPGQFQTQPVRLNEITPDGVRRLAFDRSAFDYGKNKIPADAWGDIGHGGFRVHHAINNPGYKDEVVVFLGASYLRALGQGQRYGLSARGLGIDTVGGKGEEFPRFTEFWIERPTAQVNALVIYALLDSPRATGAYRFTLRPGESTALDVQARLFLRAGVSTLGLAPLTSMFQHGENQPRRGDFRPEVHDSDGLMAASGTGEWLWRPLNNPAAPLVTSLAMNELKGFGLMQRDRAFSSYEDVEARYERRPSTWITPQGGAWGAGRVELYQWPTANETNDNIVAYWVPEKVPAPGQPFDFAYRMQWQGDNQQRPPHGWTVQSRRGGGLEALPADEVQYVLDFDGPALRALPGDAQVEAVVTTSAGGRVVEHNAYRNDSTGQWRLALRLKHLNPAQPFEVRAFLQQRSTPVNNALTETWTSLIQPD
jgi:glucans biosynthesis protein